MCYLFKYCCLLCSSDVFQTLVRWRTQGLTRDQISRIPTRVFKRDTGKDTTQTEEASGSAKVDDDDSKDAKGVEAMDATTECPICYSEFADNETLRILPCSHEFHIQCIDQWIEVRVVSIQDGGGGG